MRYLYILAFFVAYLAQGQVGIGTDTPNPSSRLDVSANDKGFLPPRISLASFTDSSTISSPATGLLIYCIGDAGLAAGYYFWNGSSWTTIAQSGGTTNYGDVKTGFQTADHNGWIKLDGRAISNLSATQQAQATAFGFTTNLPNATDAHLVQNGGALGAVTGTNTKTISQANLPNVTLSGNTAYDGSHSHTNTFSSANAIYTWDARAGGAAGWTTAGSSTTSSAGSHRHSFVTNSINGGVTQTQLDISPKSLSVNTFIYLGS
jgi:hypothetical protein